MKKFLSLALALMLVLSCLTGIALADEKPTIKVLACLDPRSPELNTLSNYQRIEEKAGVIIDWEFVRTDAWQEQKSLVMASGDLPDVFLGTNTIKIADIVSNVEYFMPLDELVAEYGQNIQKMWEAYPNTKIANTLPDGKVYAIGHSMAKRPATLAAQYINKTWLDNLGLEMPTTLDELNEVLIAFRDQDANGNGDPNDEIPYVGRKVADPKYGPSAFRGYFQADNCVENEFGVTEDGTVIFLPVTENYKTWVEWSHWLYAEKLINEDFATIDGTRYQALQSSSEGALAGVISGWTHSKAGQWMDQYEILDIEEGPYGQAYVAANLANLACGVSGWSAVCITTNCENPEAAMRWIDCFYDELEGLQAYVGPLGTTIEDNGDGTYSWIMDEARDAELGYRSYDNWYWSMGDQNPGWVSPEMDAQMEIAPTEVDKMVADEAYANNVRPESYIYPPVVLDRDQNDRAVEIKTDMDKLITEKLAKWITEGGVEEEWDSYISELNKMGLEEYIEIYQNRLNEVSK